ncbi:MAG: folylpolyglutamate synthase [Actinomycetota bacterium]
MNHAEALAYLDEHASYERQGRIDEPSLRNITALTAVMGDPHHDFRVVHVTGTNGKGSTSQIITKLLMAHGLRVGTYASPHLERINERILIDGAPVDDETFAENIAAVADAEVLAGVRPSFFEILTAAAFRCFSDAPVDVAVVEVGMLGRWDATNVVDSDVAVITNIALDHTEYAGPTVLDIAREKVGIVKENSAVIIGDVTAELADFFTSAAPDAVRRGEHFECVDNHLALGGRMLEVRTLLARYADVFVPLHGRHQGDNASAAIAAVEAFFGHAIDREVLEEGLNSVVMPGRFEVVHHQPLVIIDGAHNPAGADVCAEVFFSDFDPVGARRLVVGTLRSRDPYALLSALRADEFDQVICCTAPSPRGLPAGDLAEVARSMGCDDVVVRESVAAAVDRGLTDANADDAVLVTGSLYVVGEARGHLSRVLP